jgi:histidine triad (HIT) family protein
MAFADLNPQAPTHLLVIPKRRIAMLQDATAADAELLGHLMLAAAEAARVAKLAAGYRIIINNGYDGLQSVGHLHLHGTSALRLAFWSGCANMHATRFLPVFVCGSVFAFACCFSCPQLSAERSSTGARSTTKRSSGSDALPANKSGHLQTAPYTKHTDAHTQLPALSATPSPLAP